MKMNVLVPMLALFTWAGASAQPPIEAMSPEEMARVMGLPGGGGAPASFPADFPVLKDNGGFGEGTNIGGFGGDTSKDRMGNRAAIHKIPILLVHGNGTHAQDSTWGWFPLRDFLKENGYNDSEIWAVSYLGVPSWPEMPDPHRKNIEDVRRFIDAVREYLGVQRVDIIGHSLGCGMIRAYAFGYQADGTFDNQCHRLDSIGSLVTLAGGNYGLSAMSPGEFKPGSDFEKESHLFSGITDNTPRGAASEEEQILGEYATGEQYRKVTTLDTDASPEERVWYLGLWAHNDFVDAQQPKTGRLQGADLNKGYNLGTGLDGHEAIIKSKQVFSDILPYLNRAELKVYNPAKPIGCVVDGDQCYEQATAICAQHFLAGRIDQAEHFECIRKSGGFQPVTLYRAAGSAEWTDDKPACPSP